MTIQDLGPGFDLEATAQDPTAIRGRGLQLASHLARELTVGARKAGGARVSAVLDVSRAHSRDYDFVPEATRGLPEPEEAVGGFFEREPFLRALTVEMARAVEFDHGPDAAEAAVAQLGASVGGRMEGALRDHRGIDGLMDATQMASFFCELKQAIGGDFYVIEVDDDHIVLGNRACPFGDAVRHAPALCRMTSSVFGGVAARNTGRDVLVDLQERIAVGDPECRVVIWLREPTEVPVSVHRYRGRSTG